MNLVLVTSIYLPQIGGPATYCFELARHWKDTHQIGIVTFGDRYEPLTGVKVSLVRQNYPRILRTLLRQIGLLVALVTNYRDVDTVYAQGPILVGPVSLFFARLFRKHFVIKFVGDQAWEAAFGSGKTNKLLEDFLGKPEGGLRFRFMIALERYVLRHADRIVVPSMFLKRVLIERHKVNSQHVYVIYNAVEGVDSSHRAQINECKTCKLVLVGRLVRWKRVDDVIRALGELRKHVPATLTVIGEGPEQANLSRLARELSLAEYIHFVGRLSHQETLSILARSHIYILNSVYEGLPHTVIEAMSVGVPVVATDIPGTQEIAIHDKTALLVQPGDIPGLANALLRLAQDVELRDRLTQVAQAVIQEKYLWSSLLKELELILFHWPLDSEC